MKHKQNKTITSTNPAWTGICFVLVNDSWACDGLRSVFDTPSDTALEKLMSPFPRMHQMQIVSWIGVGSSIPPIPTSTLAVRAGTPVGFELWNLIFKKLNIVCVFKKPIITSLGKPFPFS